MVCREIEKQEKSGLVVWASASSNRLRGFLHAREKGLHHREIWASASSDRLRSYLHAREQRVAAKRKKMNWSHSIYKGVLLSSKPALRFISTRSTAPTEKTFWFWVYLLNQFNTSEQVHAEINEGPVDAFPLVLFLLQHKHVMVKELLQFLISEVNTDLLEAVVLQIGRRGKERENPHVKFRFVQYEDQYNKLQCVKFNR